MEVISGTVLYQEIKDIKATRRLRAQGNPKSKVCRLSSNGTLRNRLRFCMLQRQERFARVQSPGFGNFAKGRWPT